MVITMTHYIFPKCLPFTIFSAHYWPFYWYSKRFTLDTISYPLLVLVFLCTFYTLTYFQFKCNLEYVNCYFRSSTIILVAIYVQINKRKTFNLTLLPHWPVHSRTWLSLNWTVMVLSLSAGSNSYPKTYWDQVQEVDYLLGPLPTQRVAWQGLLPPVIWTE